MKQHILTPITEDVYMEIPSGYDIGEEAQKLGFDPRDPNLCLKLNKSLYGTPQAEIGIEMFTHIYFHSVSSLLRKTHACISKRTPEEIP